MSALYLSQQKSFPVRSINPKGIMARTRRNAASSCPNIIQPDVVQLVIGKIFPSRKLCKHPAQVHPPFMHLLRIHPQGIVTGTAFPVLLPPLNRPPLSCSTDSQLLINFVIPLLVLRLAGLLSSHAATVLIPGLHPPPDMCPSRERSYPAGHHIAFYHSRAAGYRLGSEQVFLAPGIQYLYYPLAYRYPYACPYPYRLFGVSVVSV